MNTGNFTDECRKNWHRPSGATIEDLQLGCLQRIADATELMAKNHDQLIRQRDAANQSRDYWRNEYDTVRRQLSAARSQITRLKNKAKQP